MVELPSFLKKFQDKQAKEMESCKVIDVQFSGTTYQILVKEKGDREGGWVFFQLEPSGKIKDSFCSCNDSESLRGCIHQAVGYQFIYGKYPHPLHQRFASSLWHQLSFLFFLHHGNDAEALVKARGGEYRLVKKGQELFSIKGKDADGKKFLERILFDRNKETEETSLKFSNLSEDDLEAWHRGDPPQALAYELSFWCDLGKELLLEQEKNPKKYAITFSHSKSGIPNGITADFPHLKVFWHLSEKELPEIIPGLEHVHSPLKVFREIPSTLLYDIHHRHFAIAETKEPLKKIEGKKIADWTYNPKKGFYYQKTPEFIRTSKLLEVDEVLQNHLPEVKELLIGTTIHETPLHLRSKLEFDPDWNLKVESYIDSEEAGVQYFDKWVFLTGKGFYPLVEKHFPQNTFTVPSADVAEFVSQHRAWFNMQKGFKTHISSIEAELSYSLNETNHLTFFRTLSVGNGTGKVKDFGRWIYVEDQGFFSKTTNVVSHVPINTPIPAEQVSLFIRTHEQDMSLVKDFFSPECPIASAGLTIHANKRGEIAVKPVYKLLPKYERTPLKYFDEYVYVEKEGFHELPYHVRLPERFRHPVKIPEEDFPYFFTYELPRMESYILEIDREMQLPEHLTLIAESVEKIEGGKYRLQLYYRSEIGTTPLADLVQAFYEKKRYLFTKAGRFDLHSKRFHWIRLVSKEHLDVKNNIMIVSPLELLRANAYEKISVDKVAGTVDDSTEQLLKELTEFRSPDEPDITGLQSHLRPYQLLGVKWLWFLYHHSLSGLLCDDMGLGKTHQTMALLMAIINYQKKVGSDQKKHFLIICPTSVIYHWQEKLSEFLPSVKVWTYYGVHRSLEKFYEESDILLTSYGVFRNEREVISKMKFEVAIFDELQIAKNQSSRIYQSLLSIDAKMKLGLTGTPIENRLRELKALFDIILPGYMPNEEEFRDLFIKPIEKGDNQERKEMLTRLIKPFVLRRKKGDVLIDLPEKIEEISHCDLAPEQMKLYSEVFQSSREKIVQELSDESSPVPYMHIFALFSHLKQICNHPAAYLKRPYDYKNYQSGKWDLFKELLEEARESQQKVVVFSQYLSMLDIIEDYLNEHEIGYATIRGATANRGEQLARFKEDPKCEVFVASLQAAGLGVDLTSASVVIHYDRWWNAARENQATDRVHRIGQTRGVQVFKLMTKNTLEEHINSMIFKKGKLLEEVVGIDEHEVIKKLDRGEMIQLLQTLQKEIS